MTEMEIINVISQVGFPIAVATYSLVVLNKTVQENTKVMQRIANKLEIVLDEEP
ncbi:MAG: YvrJ family protein [Tissierellia bacterium]|nr:YvrJ family protein [Tissierellia bacterium]